MPGSNPTKKESLQIDVLLNEYQACHRNRNHYDGVRWTIGSIFIGASLTLFGISLAKEINALGVIIAYLFSLGLILLWYFFSQHVSPYIISSYVRAQDIEDDLRKLKYDIELHTLIHSLDPKNKDKTKNQVFNVKGTKITYSLVLLVLTLWSLRALLSVWCLNNFAEIVIFAFTIVFSLSVFAVFHMYHKKFNDKLEDRIRQQLKANKAKKS